MNRSSIFARTETKRIALFWLASISVAFLYSLTLILLPLYVFWSPDEGGKFLQTIGYQHGQGLNYILPYGGILHDPLLSFYPPGSVYPRPSPSGVTICSWPFLFPILSRVAYNILGLWGIYVLPLASGIATAILSGLIARRILPALGWIAVLAVGICTPLWFYSVLFWEHSFSVALGMASVYSTLLFLSSTTNWRKIQSIFLALTCLLISILIRFDMLIFASSLFIAIIMVCLLKDRKKSKHIDKYVILYVALTVVISVTALQIYSLSIFSNLQFPSYSNVLQLVFDRISNLSLGTLAPLTRHVQSVLINEPNDFGVSLSSVSAMAALLLVVVALIVCWLFPRIRMIAVPLVTVIVSILAFSALITPSRHRALHGILVSAPYSTFALTSLFTRGDIRTPSHVFIIRLTLSYLVLFLLASFFIDAGTGGPEWGTRYGLVVYPLLTILSIEGVYTLLSARVSTSYQITVLTIAVFAFAIACQSSLRGIMEIRTTKQDLVAFESKLRQLSLPAVTDLWWMGAAISPYFAANELYTVINPNDAKRVWIPSRSEPIFRFVYISYGDGLDVSGPKPKIVLQSHSVINGMSFRTYEVHRE